MKGENKFAISPLQIVGERNTEYTVRIKGFNDKLLDNNTAKALVYTNGKPRILLVDTDVKQAKDLAYALEQEGIKVDVRPTQGIPDSLSDLQNYELIALSNVPATAMSTRQMNLIRTYVQELGGGLLMIGGDQSFGLGGYYKSTVEEILPVGPTSRREKEKPSIAMVLVIDKSGSMGGQRWRWRRTRRRRPSNSSARGTRSACARSTATCSGSPTSSRRPTRPRSSTRSAPSRPAAARSWGRRWRPPTRPCRAPRRSSSTRSC